MKAEAYETAFEKLILRSAALRVGLLFLFHAGVFASCYFLATLVRFEFSIPPRQLELFQESLPLVVAVHLLLGSVFGYYRGWWRYVGITDVGRLALGLAASSSVLAVMWYLAREFEPPHAFGKSSRGALLINFTFTLLALFGARVVVRVSRDRFRPSAGQSRTRRVVIIGAGDAGETLAREIEHRPQLGMRVVAFVDDHRAKWGFAIRGIKVTGPISNIAEIAASVGAEEALIAIPSASGKRIREVVGFLSEANLPSKTIPGFDHIVSGAIEVTKLRPVNLEDLLRRERIELPGDPVKQLFHGKRVVVTGAGGTIGGELALQILAFEPETLVLAERSEFALYDIRKRLSRELPHAKSRIVNALVDVQNTTTTRTLIESVAPHIVLHAAAHKHVPLGEENPPEYLRNNTLATADVAAICEAAGVERFVLISTDKAINPSSVMGASKRAAEILLLDVVRRSTSMRGTVVRFGNVLGPSGSVVPLFMEQIAQGGPITVTHPDVTRYFLRTSEAVSLVLQAATLGHRGDVFMLDMGEPVRIADLARDLLRLSNHTAEEIPIVFSGLRPGEKLFEEIRLHDESARPTVHPQIVVTAAGQPDPLMVQEWIRNARARCESGGDAVHLFRTLIPEYAADAMHLTACETKIPIRRAAPAFLDTPAASAPTRALSAG